MNAIFRLAWPPSVPAPPGSVNTAPAPTRAPTVVQQPATRPWLFFVRLTDLSERDCERCSASERRSERQATPQERRVNRGKLPRGAGA